MGQISGLERDLLYIAGVLVLIAGALIGWRELRARFRKQPEITSVWLPVPLSAGIVAYWRCAQGMPPIGDERITEAIREVVNLLERQTNWTKSLIWAALNGVRVLVGPDEAGPHAHSTARLYEQGMVVVGPSLVDLAHELIHVIEARAMKTVDLAHDAWPIYRLDVVDEHYRRSATLAPSLPRPQR